MSFLRKRGIRLVIYLDDILIMNSCPEGLARDVALVRSTQEEVGFLINDKKIRDRPHSAIRISGTDVGYSAFNFGSDGSEKRNAVEDM
jgi:hypothetical protein